MVKIRFLQKTACLVIRMPIISLFLRENCEIGIIFIKIKERIKRKSMQIIYKIPIIKRLEREILELRMALVRKESSIWDSEVDFILQNGPCRYPYTQFHKINNVETGYDDEFLLPYVIHNGKKLYYPRGFNLKKCERNYRSLVEFDCIIGGNYMEKQPHQYQSDTFKIEKGDILVDVGCAEALLALDEIDNLSKVYLIESDKRWIPALKATFMSYQDKVVIFDKLVSDHDSSTTVTLETVLKNEISRNIFVKMDIEGAEVKVLKESCEFLSNRSNIKLAVCTYHRQSDGDKILSMFEEMGYKHEFSEGWVFFCENVNEIRFPYFRHGVIRGWN